MQSYFKRWQQRFKIKTILWSKRYSWGLMTKGKHILMGKCLWLLTKYSHCNNNQFKEEDEIVFYVVTRRVAKEIHPHPLKASFLSHLSYFNIRNENYSSRSAFISLSILITGEVLWVESRAKSLVCGETFCFRQTKRRVSSLLNLRSSVAPVGPLSQLIIVCLKSSMFVRVLALKY